MISDNCLITSWLFASGSFVFAELHTALSLLSELQAPNEVLQLPTAEILELYFAEGARHRLRAKVQVSVETAAMKVLVLHMHPKMLCSTVLFKGGGIASCFWVRQLSFQRRLSGTACFFLRSWNALNCNTRKLFATACKYSWAATRTTSRSLKVKSGESGIVNPVLLSKLWNLYFQSLKGGVSNQVWLEDSS